MQVKVIKPVVVQPPNKYEVTLTQEELNYIIAFTGATIGGGWLRTINDRIYYGLEKYRTEGARDWFLSNPSINERIKQNT